MMGSHALRLSHDVHRRRSASEWTHRQTLAQSGRSRTDWTLFRPLQPGNPLWERSWRIKVYVFKDMIILLCINAGFPPFNVTQIWCLWANRKQCSEHRFGSVTSWEKRELFSSRVKRVKSDTCDFNSNRNDSVAMTNWFSPKKKKNLSRYEDEERQRREGRIRNLHSIWTFFRRRQLPQVTINVCLTKEKYLPNA